MTQLSTACQTPWYPCRTQLGYICSQCGLPLRWKHGYVTKALTTASCFTSSLASSAKWSGAGNTAIDWE